MALNLFEVFEMHFDKPIQLILGTNGSGKSSLLAMIWPQVPDRKDFHKGGSYTLEILHNGVHYVLHSDYATGQKHSFKANGVEYNEGGTAPVQKQLIEQHFHVNPNTQKLVIGWDRFTRMSGPRRKECFIELCDTDYQYALKVYNHFRQRHRDVMGTLKLTKQRLVEETGKLLKDTEVEALKKDVSALYDLLSHLLEYRKPVEEDPDLLRIQQGDVETQLHKTARQLLSLKKYLEGEAAHFDSSISLDELQQRIAAQQALMAEASKRHKKNEEKIAVLRRAEEKSAEEVQQRISKALRQRSELQADSIIIVLLDNPVACRQAFDAVKGTLEEVFTALPPNIGGHFSRERREEAKRELQGVMLEHDRLVRDYQQLQAKIRHMESHKDQANTQCPKCDHRFSLHYNEAQHLGMIKEADALAEKIDKELKIKIKHLNEYIEDCNNYAQIFRGYYLTVNNTPQLQPYWDYCTELGFMPASPAGGLTALTQIDMDLVRQTQMHELTRAINNDQELLKSLRDVGGADLNLLLKQNEELEASLSNYISALQKDNDTLKRLQQWRKATADYQELRRLVRERIRERTRLGKMELESVRRQYYNEMVRQLQSVLAEKEHRLATHKTQQAIVDNIQGSIETYVTSEQALGHLVRETSPTEGLVAEGLFGFINNFVRQMNSFISKVWTYRMEIQSCSLDSSTGVDLDYRFPVKISNGKQHIDDVAFGSSGQQEIFDLAFRIVAVHYLGLRETPFFLDEFGITFDEAHRTQATQVVKLLSEQRVFPQLFVISHYETTYGALSNADICVINPMNVIVPKGIAQVNHHVKMS